MNKAFVFPGQGSQFVGMGRDFFDCFPVARYTFQAVDDVLCFNLSKIMFEGPMDTLTETTNAQLSIMAMSAAITNVIFNQSGLKISQLCKYAAGHSLGEYSALCVSCVLTTEDTVKLLKIRSSSMKKACDETDGTMIACIGVKKEILEKVIIDSVEKLDGVCQIANDNSQNQIVVSGDKKNIEFVTNELKEQNYKTVKLNVYGAFHSKLMHSAVDPMKHAVGMTSFKSPDVPIIQNVVANPVTDPEDIKNNIIEQICSTVRWRETTDKLNELSVEEIIEIGPGTVLSNFAKRSEHKFKVTNISNVGMLDTFLTRIC